jgi:putative alpha-1,2-mannosidase
LDRKVLDEPFITYTQIVNGNLLEFEMGKNPNPTAFKNN